MNIKNYLQLLVDVLDNHYRAEKLIEKVKQILQTFENSIKQTFSNSKTFNIIKSNKIIVLYLIEEKVLRIDENIVKLNVLKRLIVTFSIQKSKHPLKEKASILSIFEANCFFD